MIQKQTNQKQTMPKTKFDDDDTSKIFPQRLMDLLDDPSSQDAIIWLPHGKSFLIIDRQKFASKVLPKYFRKTKFASFTRKLNRWNFSRVTEGPDLGAYYHEFFQRGNEALCIQMYCKNNRFKFATTQGKSSSATKTSKKAQQLVLPNMVQSLSPKINPQQFSLPNMTQSLPPKINTQASLTPNLMNYSFNSKILAPTTIDPIVHIKTLIAKQQAKIRQEQLKLTLLNMNKNFIPSQLQTRPHESLQTRQKQTIQPRKQPMKITQQQHQSMTKKQLAEKVALMEMQLKSIQLRMKQDQLRTQQQKSSMIRKTSATAA